MKENNKRKRSRMNCREELRAIVRIGMIRYPRMHRGGCTAAQLQRTGV